MQIIQHFFVAIITVYLGFTNFIADGILSLSSGEQATLSPAGEDVEVMEEENKLSLLPSSITTAIPDILLRSSEYQKAAVLDSVGQTSASVSDPLESIVNILCTYTTPTYVRTTTGTGFFIDPDGVIMTNAHVAQFLLLENRNEGGSTECIIRSGNPAIPQYKAKLLYISPAWVQQNVGILNEEIPMGTGERDYALIYASSRVDAQPLPAVFPALKYDSQLLSLNTRGNTVTAAGYPASELLARGPEVDLFPRKAETTISELYTFGSNHADIFSIRGTIVGSEGASGGPIVDSSGTVIGMITTRGDDTIDGAGSLRAITLAHIESTIQEETGFTLETNLNGNLPYRSQVFNNTLSPFLLALLQQEQ